LMSLYGFDQCIAAQKPLPGARQMGALRPVVSKTQVWLARGANV